MTQQGAVAPVTGANKGIGREIVRRLAPLEMGGPTGTFTGDDGAVPW